MPCVRCTGLAEEVSFGGIDEGLCNFCGQHFLKSTNHIGPWKVYVQTDCPECRWIKVNTDGVDFYNIHCSSCNAEYMWTKPTGWEQKRWSTRPHSIPTEPKQYPLLQYREKFPRAANTDAAQEFDTYQSCYWKYVNSDNYDDAKYWHNQMLAKVSLDLQPIGGSWVKEPVAERKLTKADKGFPMVLFILMVFVCIVVPVLVHL